MSAVEVAYDLAVGCVPVEPLSRDLPRMSMRGIADRLRELPEGRALVIPAAGFNRWLLQRDLSAVAVRVWGAGHAKTHVAYGKVYVWRVA